MHCACYRYGALAGIVGGVGLGLLADRYISTRGQRKRLLVASCALGALGFALFSLACTRGGVLDFAPDGARVAVIYGASIFGSLWANAATPIYYELAVEATYPVAEGLTTTAITLVQNGFCFAFLLVPEMLPQLGTTWMSWAVTGACTLSLLMLLPLAEPRRRLAVDTAAVHVAPLSPAHPPPPPPGQHPGHEHLHVVDPAMLQREGWGGTPRGSSRGPPALNGLARASGGVSPADEIS